MNRPDILSLVLFASMAMLVYFSSLALQARITPLVRQWLRPLAAQMFPPLKMEPWLFEPIATEGIPAAQRRFFETHTPGFVIRGFSHLGDFVLCRDGGPSCVRYFLSRDRTVIGGLTCYLGERAIECLSVLLDGFYLETASIDCPELPPAEHGLQFFTLRTDDASELIEHHAASLAKTAATRRTSPATLEPNDIPAAINYGRQLSLHSLHQQGILPELPDFLHGKAEAVPS